MIEPNLVEVLEELADTFPLHKPPKRTSPCLSYRRISTSRQLHHDGPSGLVSSRFQITTHAGTHGEASDLADQVRRELDGRTKALGSTHRVHLVEVVNETDLGFMPETETWQVAIDAIVYYTEA